MRRTNLAILIGIAVLWSSQVSALDFPKDWYFGASAGVSNNLNFCAQTGDATFCDKEDFAWKIIGGYQFVRWVGLEVGYVYLGEPDTPTFTSGVSTVIKSESNGLAISVPFYLPYLERIGLYGKVGGYWWDRESLINDGFGGQTKASADGFDPFWGVGFRWPLTDSFGVSLEYEKYLDVGNATVGISDIEMFSVGAIWQF